VSRRNSVSTVRAGDLGHRILLISSTCHYSRDFLRVPVFPRSPDKPLSLRLGLIPFSAVAQIAPAFFGGLFWRGATARGAIAGLISGFLMWMYTLALPNLATPDSVLSNLVTQGPFGFTVLKPTALLGLQLALHRAWCPSRACS